MDFYNHRFDFLRKSNESAPGNLSSSTVANTNTYYNNILPFSKEVFVDVFSEGEISDLKNKILENVVNGSTCFYVDNGDFYIFYEGYWYNPETGLYYNEGDNPYEGGVG